MKMETLRIDILNPKAKQLLKDLADLNLIAFKKEGNDFSSFLEIIRGKADKAPSMEEITKEVEAVRANRNED